MEQILFQYPFPAVGGLILFLTLVLFIWTFLIKKGTTAWNTIKNLRFLYADTVVGMVLVVEMLIKSEWYNLVMLPFILGGIISHFQRVGEYVMKKPERFCTNKVLFYVNDLNLVLLFGLLFVLIPF